MPTYVVPFASVELGITVMSGNTQFPEPRAYTLMIGVYSAHKYKVSNTHPCRASPDGKVRPWERYICVKTHCNSDGFGNLSLNLVACLLSLEMTNVLIIYTPVSMKRSFGRWT